jgi:type VI secretion system Hcp family effector
MKPTSATSPVGTMQAIGAKQGPITGKPSAAGADRMNILSFKMGSEAPLDPKSSGAGQKQHHLIVLTKEIDPASPKFQTAFTSAEQFNKIEILLDKKNPNGKKPQPTKVTLTNATIAQIRKTEAGMEEIAFSFQAINVQSTDGSTSTSDDWSANVQ